jgi:hypothetical protein
MVQSQGEWHRAPPRVPGYRKRNRTLTRRFSVMLRGGAAALVSLAVAGACLVSARESGRALPAFAANGAAALRPGLPYEIAVDGVPLPRVAPRWELRQYPLAEPQQRVARAVVPAAGPVPVAAVPSQPLIDIEYAWIAAETPQLLTVSLPDMPLPVLTGEPGVSPTQSLALTLLRHRNLTGFSVVWPSDAPASVAEPLLGTQAAPSRPTWLTQAWLSPAPLHAAKAAVLARQLAAGAKPGLVVSSGSRSAAVTNQSPRPQPSGVVIPRWPAPLPQQVRTEPAASQEPEPAPAAGPDETADSGAGGTAADVELSAGPQAGQAVPRARGSRRAHRRQNPAAAVRWPPRAVVRAQARPAAVRSPPVRSAPVRQPLPKPVVIRPVAKPVVKPVFKAAPKPQLAVPVKKPPAKPVKVFVAKPKAVVTKPKPAKPQAAATAAPKLPRWTTN